MSNMKRVFVQLEAGRGYGRDLLKGIYDYNKRYSNWEIIFEPAYYLKINDTRDVVDMIKLMKPDGCILEHIEQPGKLADLGIPIIQVSSADHVAAFPCLKGNYAADGKMAFDYFVNAGFNKLGFFGVEHLEWSKVRLESFKQQAALAGIPVYDHHFKVNKNNDLHQNFNYLITWLNSLPKPIGILCCNDDFGQMLINACSIGNIKVPHEIAVLGIDNDELLCNIASPNLSSIARNHVKAAFNTCEILDSMMRKDSKESPLVINLTEPTDIVVRASTDIIASNDEEVIKAIRHIRQFVHLPLTVGDIVKVTNLSRRALYTRFKLITGNTINEEIQKQKLKKFKELLKDQKLSIKEVAFQLGFDDTSHVSRWFAAIEGVSPAKWRQQNL